MPTREQVVEKAKSFNGVDDGHGYNCSNPFSTDLGRAQEAWCGDFVTDVYKRAGLPLPSMQSGCRTGFAFVPSAWESGARHDALRKSFESQPGDLAVFCWPGGNVDGDHTEMVIHWANGVLRTIGGNSNGSNVDHFKGTGGVHVHDWEDPEGKGDSVIKGCINTAKFVDFASPGTPVPPPVVNPEHPRPLSLKSPHLVGADVEKLQSELNSHLKHVTPLVVDGVFGPATDRRLTRFQHTINDPFGVCRAHTRKALGIH